MHPHPSNRQGEIDAAERLPYAIGIAELEGVAGRDAALSIISACAGRSILVRAEPGPEDELAQIVGQEMARSLAVKLLAGERQRMVFIDQPSFFALDPGEEPAPGPVNQRQRIGHSTGLAALEGIVGRATALAIIEAFAGCEVFVRAIPLPSDELTALIGLDAAQAIADELLGDEDKEGQSFFIHQPTYQVTVPGEKVAPVLDAIAPKAELALPGVLGKIERLCGRDAALKIAAHYGGRRVYLPFAVTPKSTIAKVIGFEAAQTLADEWDGGSLINIPSAAYGSTAIRRDLGMKMLRDGYRPADVVRLLKVSRTQVFEWSKKIKEEQK